MNSKRQKAKSLHRLSLPPPRQEPDVEEVGYGKPPRRFQFKPGQCGNPKGRPKGARNLATQVRSVLGRRIVVLDRGQRKSMSAAEAILHRYLELALKGDVKAGAFLLKLFERFNPTQSQERPADVLTDGDREIVGNLLNSSKGSQKE